jgi:hypothetical protein
MKRSGAFMLGTARAALLTASFASASTAAPVAVPATGLDHILLGAPDLDRGVAEVRRLTGVRAVYGGSHPGAGTRNALIALGNGAYLEIIAPDPKQKPSELGAYIRSLHKLTPIGWAYHTRDLEGLREALAMRSVHVHQIVPGSRRRPDGRTLSWRTFEIGSEEDVAPFFIQWGRGSPHPSLDAAPGCRLAGMSVGGRLKVNVERALAIVGQSAIARPNAAPGLHFAMRCRGGAVRF